MNEAIGLDLIDKALASKITFPEILATLAKESVDSYHVDFLRNECRFYAKGGGSTVVQIDFIHGGVAPEFSPEAIEAINKKVQAGAASYADFVKEGTGAGCACYAVYVNGKKARYFGRDGGEYVQLFPGSR
jgi:uncharacterized protein YbcV (DUF1398 family)